MFQLNSALFEVFDEWLERAPALPSERPLILGVGKSEHSKNLSGYQQSEIQVSDNNPDSMTDRYFEIAFCSSSRFTNEPKKDSTNPALPSEPANSRGSGLTDIE